MLSVVVDPTSLRQSSAGSITGRITLATPDGFFPEEFWNDFPVTILGWWIEGLSDIVAGRRSQYQGLFMDGDFSFLVKTGIGGIGRISVGPRDRETEISGIDARELLSSAIFAAREISAACRQRGWENADLGRLEGLVAGMIN